MQGAAENIPLSTKCNISAKRRDIHVQLIAEKKQKINFTTKE